MEENVTVNLLSLAEKAQSKWELYNLLTVEGDLYLPPYKECTVLFITDIIHGKKVMLDTLDVCSLLLSIGGTE
jgi:hypothetical protein